MTYSVVARCPETGQFGVGVVTGNFAVGSVVPWVRAGVGAVATQARTRAAFGPQGLDLLAAGCPASEAIDVMLADDDGRERRQVGVVGVTGACAFTGSLCIPEASHLSTREASFQANFMRSPATVEVMGEAWERGSGSPLDLRLLDVLTAAEVVGGDLRGQQSAALKVAASAVGEGWEGALVDIRVDDHAAPLEELRRLVRVASAYRAATDADQLEVQGDSNAAAEKWREVTEIMPGLADGWFWRGVLHANHGDLDSARHCLSVAFERNPDFREVLARLPDAGLIDARVARDLA